jgi:predicted RNA binding protein YcfA (HicA-like mRNA interferase family)
MAVLDAKQTYKNLLKKGFIDSPNRSDDHKYLELYFNETLVLYTKISHGEKDLNDHLIKQMYTQCKLGKIQFLNLARCPMSKDEYFTVLREDGFIEENDLAD